MELPGEWVKKIKVDAIKYESATQHEGLGPAIYEDGAMAYAPWLYTCQTNYAALKEKYDNILATEDGHENKTENVWQSGYAAGHETATDKHKAEFERIQKSAIHYANRKDEVEKQRDELQAKCDKYEAALREIRGEPVNESDSLVWIRSAKRTANEALSAGEGDRICPNCNKVFNADRHGNCRKCGSDEYNNQKEDKQ